MPKSHAKTSESGTTSPCTLEKCHELLAQLDDWLNDPTTGTNNFKWSGSQETTVTCPTDRALSDGARCHIRNDHTVSRITRLPPGHIDQSESVEVGEVTNLAQVLDSRKNTSW